MKEILFEINNYNDREKIVLALANSGYKVSVKKSEKKVWENDIYIVSVIISDECILKLDDEELRKSDLKILLSL